jgi:hypothetical protein
MYVRQQRGLEAEVLAAVAPLQPLALRRRQLLQAIVTAASAAAAVIAKLMMM